MDGGTATPFQDLTVWQKSQAPALSSGRVPARFPKTARCDLAVQVLRAAVSIPANLGGGSGRSSKFEKRRFLNVARASLEELRYHFILANDLGYSLDSSLSIDVDEAGRMLEACRPRISPAAS
jgi:four helix bundle protein